MPEKFPDKSVQENAPSPTSLFGGQDFSGIGSSTQSTVLSTGKKVPTFEQFIQMSPEQKNTLLLSLTPEERQEFAESLRPAQERLTPGRHQESMEEEMRRLVQQMADQAIS